MPRTRGEAEGSCQLPASPLLIMGDDGHLMINSKARSGRSIQMEQGETMAQAPGSSPRLLMQQFWEEHSRECSLQEMMLDSGAEALTQEDTPEILALLPCMEGKDILELGAGIGRFTGFLAERARHITAVDFMDTFLTRNRKQNGHHPNITFQQADITTLQMPSQSLDLVFSNWLFMYLSDAELSDVVQKLLLWLRPGGHLFFRESCFFQSGDTPRAFNPTLYRMPSEYNRLLASAQMASGEELYGFEIVMSRSVQAYIKRKQNRNQVCWLLQKVLRNREDAKGYDTFQTFLDNEQYAVRSIRRYEWIFGPGFVSTGGLSTTKELLNLLSLKPSQKVLDVGCGIGGSDFYMAKEFGVEVLGMDLSHNMIEMALERAQKETGFLVQFEIGNATRRTFPEDSFDVVYSRDTILHVADKRALFRRFLSWLKPGGELLVSDYCCGPHPWSKVFTEYVQQRGYNLLTPEEYGQALQEAGFVQVKALDHTERMLLALTQELQELERSREQFVQEFSEDEFKSMASGWREKLYRCADGDQRWGVFYARKPQ
ncbi:phosphoethanolamine N-methyltransferase 1-like [Sceloporus undulatus]|uniref:phosphoethanolamine N-methyltransferase 1-like n=1 Tax=Sceloporus undulatus TaxID=8520 RepID=UPI001C4B27F9|nr:phosphoethanolamine N-methyltransferase 1-like [Sceloporus undulatus]